MYTNLHKFLEGDLPPALLARLCLSDRGLGSLSNANLLVLHLRSSFLVFGGTIFSRVLLFALWLGKILDASDLEHIVELVVVLDSGCV